MSGPDYDEDGPDEFRPPPHPDDRLWRHPSEVAAMHAHANAETAKVPVVTVAPERRSRATVGLLVAAGVVVVGAAALTIGVVSSPGRSSTTPATTSTVSLAAGSRTSAESPATAPQRSTSSVAAGSAAAGEELLTARVHNAVAVSLPRIQAAMPQGTREGSGLFVTDDGHIATSAGLIANAASIVVWTDDGQRWKADVVATDPISDVAVLQIDSDDWPAVSLGSGTGLRTGQYALAIDHEHNEMVLGEIAAVAGDGIKIDHANLLPGSAILDDTGDVIAMVTYDGKQPHATPVWILEQVTVDLITTGSTTHTWLGVLVESDPDNADMVIVGDVAVDSPADEAGLRPGDLIDSVNGTSTPDAIALQRQIQSLNPGDDAVLTVTRNGSRRIIIATLSERLN